LLAGLKYAEKDKAMSERRRSLDRGPQTEELHNDATESRAEFLGRAGLLALGALGIAPSGCVALRPTSAASHVTPSKKSRGASRIKRWDVVTIGNLSRNRYWGESEARAVRSAICTCTVVSGPGFHLLVDPSIEDGERMAAELDRRTGLKPRDIDTVFITHDHGDHHYGLKHFPDAKWLAAAEVAAILNKSRRYSRNVEPVERRILDAVDVIPTPGHTPSHHSLRFDCDGLSVVVAGDAVATRDFWGDRRSYFNAVDPRLASQTMDRIAAMADVVVPGHDNYFLVLPLSPLEASQPVSV
jgi:glyoxylase-like metal-dependent hydrolase (beta-lactamase superfamily II)